MAVTDKAKERIKDTTVYLYENELRKHLRNTTEARFFIEKIGTPPLQNISEMQDILQISEKGDCLTPYQLERVETVLVAIRRLWCIGPYKRHRGVVGLSVFDVSLDLSIQLRFGSFSTIMKP